jgi:hypothetical protein
MSVLRPLHWSSFPRIGSPAGRQRYIAAALPFFSEVFNFELLGVRCGLYIHPQSRLAYCGAALLSLTGLRHFFQLGTQEFLCAELDCRTARIAAKLKYTCLNQRHGTMKCVAFSSSRWCDAILA